MGLCQSPWHMYHLWRAFESELVDELISWLIGGKACIGRVCEHLLVPNTFAIFINSQPSTLSSSLHISNSPSSHTSFLNTFPLWSMANIETPSLGRPDWLSELPTWIEQVQELRKTVQRSQEFADGVAYNHNIQSRFTALHEFITRCGFALWKSAWKSKRIRMWNDLKAGTSPQSPDTESPDTESPDTEPPNTEIYNTLKLMAENCQSAAHQSLKGSWEKSRNDLDVIVQLMEQLSSNTTVGDLGLGSLGAYGEKAFAGADGEEAEFGTEVIEYSRVDHA